ncbi:peptidylprolyl isomerase [Moraxella sp. FZFQ2102]|uniref:peptidylprolyl isomerase n=1 Tax=Moraxella sp. FZFQ2102 TaxID=2953752 RepID=UPI0035323262
MDMPIVEFDTTYGNIVIELNAEKAPVTVANFIDYVESGHYDGLIFHRVIDGFMIQGGGMDSEMKEKRTGTPIKNEADNGLRNDTGTIAMARTSDPHSATAQFFINVRDNDFLNYTSPTPQGWGYAVFGRVIDGMDIVNQIKGVPTGRFGYHADVPTTPIVINSAKVIKK